MNTPAHILINLDLLGNSIKPKMATAIIQGGLSPDIPAFIFYIYEKLMVGTLTWSFAIAIKLMSVL